MENKIRNFTDLNAWKEAHKLVLMIYRITDKFPVKEQYVLTSQILRAVISITSNLAEGFGRFSKKEKIQFYWIAISSLTEVQNQLFIARDVKYIKSDIDFNMVWNQTIIVQKLISGLISSLKKW